VDTSVIGEILSSDLPLESKCHALIDAAKQAGGPDNITAVLLSVV
jgi:serine/threonine protein phosphatase PrpC